MPLYVLLTKLTSDGRKSVMNDPGRIFKVHKELETMGAKIIAQYAVLGDYDFVNIIEAQSNEVIARISAQFGSRGTLEVTTLAAITMQDYVRELETFAQAVLVAILIRVIYDFIPFFISLPFYIRLTRKA